MSKAAGLFVSGALGCMTAMAWGGWGSAPPTPPASPPLRTAREEPGAADAGKGPQVPAVQSSVVGVPIYRIEDPKEMLKYGFPGPVTDVASRMGYISAWDRRTRNPAWVLEKLTPDTVRPRNGSEGGVKVQRRNVFTEDPSIPEMFRTRLSDFYRSGYDRGHMVRCVFKQSRALQYRCHRPTAKAANLKTMRPLCSQICHHKLDTSTADVRAVDVIYKS